MRGRNEAMKYILSTIFKREEEMLRGVEFGIFWMAYYTNGVVVVVVVAGAIQCLPQSWGRLRISLFAAAMEFLNGRIARTEREREWKNMWLTKVQDGLSGCPNIYNFFLRTKIN